GHSPPWETRVTSESVAAGEGVPEPGDAARSVAGAEVGSLVAAAAWARPASLGGAAPTEALGGADRPHAPSVSSASSATPREPGLPIAAAPRLPIAAVRLFCREQCRAAAESSNPPCAPSPASAALVPALVPPYAAQHGQDLPQSTGRVGARVPAVGLVGSLIRAREIGVVAP